MADEQHGAGIVAEHLLQQVERLEVEVVGRLVEHQQVRRAAPARGPASAGRARRPRARRPACAPARARTGSPSCSRSRAGVWPPTITVSPRPPVSASASVRPGSRLSRRWSSVDRLRGWCRAGPCRNRARARRSAGSAAWSCRRRSGRRCRAGRRAGRAIEKSAHDRRARRSSSRCRSASTTSLPDRSASVAAMRTRAGRRRVARAAPAAARASSPSRRTLRLRRAVTP